MLPQMLQITTVSCLTKTCERRSSVTVNNKPWVDTMYPYLHNCFVGKTRHRTVHLVDVFFLHQCSVSKIIDKAPSIWAEKNCCHRPCYFVTLAYLNMSWDIQCRSNVSWQSHCSQQPMTWPWSFYCRVILGASLGVRFNGFTCVK